MPHRGVAVGLASVVAVAAGLGVDCGSVTVDQAGGSGGAVASGGSGGASTTTASGGAGGAVPTGGSGGGAIVCGYGGNMCVAYGAVSVVSVTPTCAEAATAICNAATACGGATVGMSFQACEVGTDWLSTAVCIEQLSQNADPVHRLPYGHR